MLALYWSVISFISLVFEYINYAFPNPLVYLPPDPYQSGISYEMASLIILLPLALLLLHLIRKDMVKDSSRKEIWVRRWALIFTLFIAGVSIAIDLVTLLTTFLSGQELAVGFLLKVLIVILVAAGVFMHFIADLWGYWEQFPSRRNSVVIGVGFLALATIVSGFFIVGTPAQARLARFDAQKVSDLQEIQTRVTSYYQAKQKLPATLADLSDALTYGLLPVDPQPTDAYSYQATGAVSFKVCATFNSLSRGTDTMQSVPVMPGGVQGRADNWSHGTGTVCFNRAIDPSFYPPLAK
jgi:hypothetical protein